MPPRFKPDTPLAEREKVIRDLYPELIPVSATMPVLPQDRPPLSLADLQQLASENSPVVRRARADADAAYGDVIQAGLHPNPTVGYEGDQIQPGDRPSNNAGQQGAYINLLLKLPAKLSLAQTVAGFDYINAQIALRRAQVDVATAVRTNYFAVLVARQTVEVNRLLVQLADEVYRLQLKQLAAGEAAGYEPLQLYAQAAQARNALVQGEMTYRAAWRQLTASVGRPDLSLAPVAGRADAPPPVFEFDRLKARLLEQHTDLLSGRNTLLQAQANLRLQQINVRPDLQTNTVVQHDNSTGNNQFNLQVGIALPVFDRNQGNIWKAKARIGRATEDLRATENDLFGRLAEAFGRYESNRAAAENYRDRILPNLTRAYRALVRRHQIEPDKVGFNDIVVAQQNLAQALQASLSALDAQWRAVVDIASLAQFDELYPPAETTGPVPLSGPPPTAPPSAPARR